MRRGDTSGGGSCGRMSFGLNINKGRQGRSRRVSCVRGDKENTVLCFFFFFPGPPCRSPIFNLNVAHILHGTFEIGTTV